ncbi:very short patch repair endonuclease [Qipengyuania aurantiaca]|uniref:Very short patch repair endonuclease n=1 Tax=Qipengyuania aurantiaca TaxID=2867233 RepID=A0ABX8ZMC9_9SPHN|nr:very short patch repair endonuclease [Qipengyuania aurantiaca]QZD89896.1 very short patch repair endonuclease [Qipengyuania aurantiaca]
MTDHVDPIRRSKIMASVGQKNTKPEMIVRRHLHRLGFRYRLHRRDLPGSPDIVFPSRKKTIFVHGCYWHGHECRWGNLPKSNQDYWRAKIVANRERDDRNVSALESMGWETLTVWQCELRNELQAIERIVEYLQSGATQGGNRAVP